MSKVFKIVAIYLRKSREDLESREETLARHERMLTDYCNRNNLIIKEIYREGPEGWSQIKEVTMVGSGLAGSWVFLCLLLLFAYLYLLVF